MKSYIENIRADLKIIHNLLNELLDNSQIREFRNDPYSNVVFLAPRYNWAKPTDIEKRLQVTIKPLYNKWYESFGVITINLPNSLKREIEKKNNSIINWIEKKNNDWSVPVSIKQAKEKLNEHLNTFYYIFDLLENTGEKEIILIPDTNSLIIAPEPEKYKKLMRGRDITIVFVPTVLSELDRLKIKGNNEAFKEKIKSIINRLKGYRKQGSLIEGVKVHKNIILRMVATEPDFNNTLSWLDSTNNDDRIIANTLDIQKNMPSSIVSLVTADINLQNKAEMARLPYYEPP